MNKITIISLIISIITIMVGVGRIYFIVSKGKQNVSKGPYLYDYVTDELKKIIIDFISNISFGIGVTTFNEFNDDISESVQERIIEYLKTVDTGDLARVLKSREASIEFARAVMGPICTSIKADELIHNRFVELIKDSLESANTLEKENSKSNKESAVIDNTTLEREEITEEEIEVSEDEFYSSSGQSTGSYSSMIENLAVSDMTLKETDEASVSIHAFDNMESAEGDDTINED